jgi:polysaccharide export outer membrane protein
MQLLPMLSLHSYIILSALGLPICVVFGSAIAHAQDGPADVLKSQREIEAYVLGPEDQIQLSVMDAEGVDGKTYRIGANGQFKVPLIGYVHAAGLTVPQLERELTTRFSQYIRKPQVTATISDFRSQPVSVIGAVNTPGVHHLQGQKTLLELLAMAGGLRQDAGHTAKITRHLEQGPIPLPGTRPDGTGNYTVAEVMLRPLLSAEKPEQGNIYIRPNDVISIPRSDIVYVVGDVVRAGGFSVNEKERMTALQALSLAGGLTPSAKSKHTRILRKSSASGRSEIDINLNAILAGQQADVPLQADDILFVPSSSTRKVTMRTVEAVVQAVTGVAIWRSAR